MVETAMIRSLHIIGSSQFGGAENFFLRLVQALNEQGHPATAVVRPNSPVCKALNGTLPQSTVPMRNGWDIFSRWSIGRLIRESGVDIVQTYMGRATRLTRLKRQSKAIHVARLGGFYKIDGYYRHADAWVGNTRALCDYLVQQGLPASRVFNIGNFVDVPSPVPAETLSKLRQDLGLPQDALVLFALGRLIEKKGFEDLLQAFALVPERVGGRPLVLVIAGDGPNKRQLQVQTASLSLDGRVCWAGWQENPTPFFQLADLFVCPSREEPLGNVILEAWAHRLPVLSTRTSGGVELIRHEENGMLVPCMDKEELAAAIKELLGGGPSSLQAMADAGHHTLLAHHTKQVVIKSYLELYDFLLHGGC